MTVDAKDGASSTTLHISSFDEATKLRQVADDLGLVIAENGFVEDDPEFCRVTIRHAPEGIRHRH